MKVLFLDTNIFLQCKPIEQLPWEEISKGNILLLISRAVQDEIDNLKQSGNSRRARRARIATSLFRQILESGNIIIRQSKSRVEVSFSPPVNQDNFSDYNLNPSRIDDQIVFEALIYRKNHKKCDVALLTHDTGPAVTAKSVGLPCLLIPDEWLLPPETDSRDKRINELERRIQELEKTYPQIEIKCLDTDYNIINALPVKLPKYQSITEAQISSIMETIKTKFPLTTDFNYKSNTVPKSITISDVMNFLQPKKEQIDKYTNEDYPKWLEELAVLLEALNTRLDLKFRNIEFFISISNIGNVPAENLVVDFILYKGLLIPPPSEFLDEKETPQNISIAFPNPPAAPKSGWFATGVSTFPFTEFQIPSLISQSFIPRPSQRDKHTFYWKPNRPTTKTNKWTLECDEFRHQIKPELFEISVHFPPEFANKRTALEVIVTAKNIPKPVKYVLPIESEYITKDTMDYAYSLIDDIKSK